MWTGSIEGPVKISRFSAGNPGGSVITGTAVSVWEKFIGFSKGGGGYFGKTQGSAPEPARQVNDWVVAPPWAHLKTPLQGVNAGHFAKSSSRDVPSTMAREATQPSHMAVLVFSHEPKMEMPMGGWVFQLQPQDDKVWFRGVPRSSRPGHGGWGLSLTGPWRLGGLAGGPCRFGW